jgi:succinyl-diaminopimelate desuccinylase
VSVLSQVLARLDAEEVVELTRALVQIPSVYRPGDPDAGEGRVAAFIEGWFRREGFQVEVQMVAPGRPNVVAWIGEKTVGRRSLLLEGHTDVVTEGDPREWTHPPFGGELIDGRIYGRGAADMKAGLAAAMVAAASFMRAGVEPRGKLVVGALVDEEGGMIGARHLASSATGHELDGAIICEPEDNELCLEQRGVVWARVRLRGRMAHGAMPEAGINPIVGIGAVLASISAAQRRLRQRGERSRYLKPATVTPTVVTSPPPGGGVPQSNVIPAVAEMTLDIRVTPGVGEADLDAELKTICQRAEAACPGLKVEWEPVNPFRLPTRVPRDEPLVEAMIGAIRHSLGRAPRFGGVPGSTDGTVLRMALGIPIVTCGPGNRLIPHQVDEYVEVEQIVDATKIYIASAVNYLEV